MRKTKQYLSLAQTDSRTKTLAGTPESSMQASSWNLSSQTHTQSPISLVMFLSSGSSSAQWKDLPNIWLALSSPDNQLTGGNFCFFSLLFWHHVNWMSKINNGAYASLGQLTFSGCQSLSELGGASPLNQPNLHSRTSSPHSQPIWPLCPLNLNTEGFSPPQHPINYWGHLTHINYPLPGPQSLIHPYTMP